MNFAPAHGGAHLEPTRDWPALLDQATREVFEIMLGAQLGADVNGKALGSPVLTGMVGLAGAACGVLSVRCSKAAANKIAGMMLGQDAADSDETIVDALGEVCNMIAGSFKAKVPGMADGCMLSVPSVISGESYELHSLANGAKCRLSVDFEGLLIQIILDLDQ